MGLSRASPQEVSKIIFKFEYEIKSAAFTLFTKDENITGTSEIAMREKQTGIEK